MKVAVHWLMFPATFLAAAGPVLRVMVPMAVGLAFLWSDPVLPLLWVVLEGSVLVGLTLTVLLFAYSVCSVAPEILRQLMTRPRQPTAQRRIP